MVKRADLTQGVYWLAQGPFSITSLSIQFRYVSRVLNFVVSCPSNTIVVLFSFFFNNTMRTAGVPGVKTECGLSTVI
jgi:hypothetical protein